MTRIRDGKLRQAVEQIRQHEQGQVTSENVVSLMAAVGDRFLRSSTKVMEQLMQPGLSRQEQVDLVRRGCSSKERDDLRNLLNDTSLQMEPGARNFLEAVLGQSPLNPALMNETQEALQDWGADRFENAPGAHFVNQLVNLDLNADGRLQEEEWARGEAQMRALADDGRGNDLEEGSVLRMLIDSRQGLGSLGNASSAGDVAAYRVENGELVLETLQGNSPGAVRFAHENTELLTQGNVMSTSGGVEVRHGDDPGNYFCEHMLYSSQIAAAQPESSVRSNQFGEPLVGFLHFPGDEYIRDADRSGYAQADRHRETREVIGSAMRGYYNELSGQLTGNETARLLVTGYGPFMNQIRNNPTGDFVSHRENIDASLQHAFGDFLLTPEGTKMPEDPSFPDAISYQYTIRDPATGERRDLVVSTVEFAVDDTAISPENPHSITQAMESLSPHAVLATGVAAHRDYFQAEHRADSGEMVRLEDGSMTHNRRARGGEEVQLRDNFSLARAISGGSH